MKTLKNQLCIFMTILCLITLCVGALIFNKKDVIEDKIIFQDSVVFGKTSNELDDESVFLGTKVALLLKDEFNPMSERDNYLMNHNVESIETVDEALSSLRDKAKSFYSEQRTEIAEKFDLTFEENIGSPYIFLDSDKKIESIRDIDLSIRSVINDPQIYKAYVFDTYSYLNENSTRTASTPETVTMDTALSQMNVTNSVKNTWSGEGVNIGIYESLDYSIGLPKKEYSMYPNISMIRRDEEKYNDDQWSAHSTEVTACAYALARKSKYFCSGAIANTNMQGFSDFTDPRPLQWFVDNGVNVINASFRVDKLGAGGQSAFNAVWNFFEKFAYDNFLTIVAAAGNDAKKSDNHSVGAPAMCNNLIAVGATNIAGNGRADFSSYKVFQNYPIAKPNLVAPGTKINFASPCAENSGTSFSAPFVTGATALLMQKVPRTKLFPERVQALLAANSDMNNFSNEVYNIYYAGFETQVGAGMINVEKLLNNSDNISSFEFGSEDVGKSLTFLTLNNVAAGKKIKISAFWYTQMSGSTRYTADYDIILNLGYGSNNVASSRSANNNMELISFTTTQTGLYSSAIQYYSSNNTPNNDYGCIAWSVS